MKFLKENFVPALLAFCLLAGGAFAGVQNFYSVPAGGTGRSTLTNHGVLVGAAQAPITQLAVGTNGQLLLGATGADPAWQTAGGVFTMAANGTSTIVANGVPLTGLAQSATNTMLGNWTSGTANVLANTMPSCSDSSGNHLNYVNGTGITCGTSGGNPSGAAGGYLSGTYPNPTVAKVLGVSTNSNATAGDVGEYMFANCPSSSSTITVTIASPAVVTWTTPPFSGLGTWTCPINFTTSGALPTGIVAGTNYWVIGTTVSGNTFQIATSPANALAATAINTSGSQSGTQTGVSNAIVTSGNPFDIAAIALTAGDWDANGTAVLLPAGGSTTSITTAWIFTTSATAPTRPAFGAYTVAADAVAANTGQVLPIGTMRQSLSGTTNVFAGEQITFATGTMAATGFVGARRMR